MPNVGDSSGDWENLLCTIPIGRRRLFSSHVLATRFGRDEADDAISVFVHHYRQLCAAGFRSTDKILEVGPGRNLGTALLMWVVNHAREECPVTVFLLDVFPNMRVTPDSLRQTAQALLESPALSSFVKLGIDEGMTRSMLAAVACGKTWPDVRYHVQPISKLLVSAEVIGRSRPPRIQLHRDARMVALGLLAYHALHPGRREQVEGVSAP